MLREERGSAFLLVLFMILLFMMLGVAVLGATIGGAKRTLKAEDNVQTLHLADKAISEAVASVMVNFNNRSIEPNELKDKLEYFVKEYNDYAKNQVSSSELNGAKAPQYRALSICIHGINPDVLNDSKYCGSDTVTSSSETDRMLRITAEAEVNESKRILVQDVKLNTYPDFLNYAVGSEGNVDINGAAYFKGNLYAGLNLRIWDRAQYYLNGNIFPNAVESQFIYVDPEDPESQSTDQAKGVIRVQSSGNVYYNDNPTNNDSDYKHLLSSPDISNEAFHELGDKLELTDTSKFISINVGQSFVDKVYASLGLDVYNEIIHTSFRNEYKKGGAEALINAAKNYYPSTDIKKMPSRRNANGSENTEYDNQVKELSDQLGSLSNSTIFEEDLQIGDELKSIYFTDKDADKWLIVDGDLTVQNFDAAKALALRGNILVTGRILLNGKIDMDSTMLILGGNSGEKNEIVDAEIHGLTIAGQRKGLVLMAAGPIDIYRVDSFTPLGDGYDRDDPKTLEAFFYTDKKAELYGVGSLFWIHGGFFAKEGVTINAVLGNTTKAANATDLTFTNQTGSERQNDARFVIDYDQNVFMSQTSALPRVDTIRVELKKKELKDPDDI